jgi:ABC-type sugar transport system, ATPase component
MLLEMRDIRKSFHTVTVLHGINFRLREGSVHVLMGENGAGKSTLMKILAGIYKCDGGSIYLKGQLVEINAPKQSQGLGISMIHQELSPIPEMTVAENIFLGREPGLGVLVDYNKMYQMTEELLESLNVKVSPKAIIGKLKVADQQLIEIAKAISLNADIIVMDEPTSAIADKEVELLFSIIDNLKKQGKGIIYISHKMEEIFKIADEITVLRDGSYINTWFAKDIDQGVLIRNMVGRELSDIYPQKKACTAETLLEIKNFSSGKLFHNIGFEVKRGEILGISGLVGAGRTEVMHALFGLTSKDSGTIRFKDKEIYIKKPQDAIKQGIAYVTEDRKTEGLVLEMGVGPNITLSSLKALSGTVFLKLLQEKKEIEKQIAALRIKVHSPNLSARKLSGGNQQKVVLAKWMMKNPELLILDEPTRGIDVGAKSEIYKLMAEYVEAGNAIIMISSEMPELMGMADRIVVLSNGSISGTLDRNEFAQEDIMKMSVQNL